MDVHKPHVPHGWRELLKEVGIIVVGVLVALAGEQTVEAIHWRVKVDDAEAAMRAELRDDDGPQAYTRLVIAECIDRQLAGLAAALEHQRDSGGPLPSGQLIWLPAVTWDSAAWSSALSSGVTIHMDEARMEHWAASYDFIPALGRQNELEAGSVAELRTLRHARAPLADAERDRLFLAIERLRRENAMTADLSYYFLENLHNAGLTARESSDGARVRSRFAGDAACLRVPVVPQPGRRPLSAD